MALETLYGSGYPDPANTPVTVLDARVAEGNNKSNVSRVEVSAAADIGSIYYLAKLPSNCILLPDSTLYHDALGTSVTLDIGDSNDPNGLASALDVAAAGNKAVMAAQNIDSYGKELWELLGYSEDPGGWLHIYATTAGAAVGGSAATMSCVLRFAVD